MITSGGFVLCSVRGPEQDSNQTEYALHPDTVGVGTCLLTVTLLYCCHMNRSHAESCDQIVTICDQNTYKQTEMDRTRGNMEIISRSHS